MLGKTSPRMDTLQQICTGLGITMAEFFAADPDALKEYENKKKPKDLIKILEQEDFVLNGRIATEEDRERIKKLIEVMYWDAKEKNKRK